MNMSSVHLRGKRTDLICRLRKDEVCGLLRERGRDGVAVERAGIGECEVAGQAGELVRFGDRRPDS